MSKDPAWLLEARKYMNVKEIKGPQHNPLIVGFWKAAKLSGIKNDEVPWCAGFVGAMLETVGVRSARSDAARAYLDWGVKLDAPVVGCIVVLGRDGGGHVGFVVGLDRTTGDIGVLGGNQSDAVNVRTFPAARVLGYRWPQAWDLPAAELPSVQAAKSVSEA